jgi:hypothetical protein
MSERNLRRDSRGRFISRSDYDKLIKELWKHPEEFEQLKRRERGPGTGRRGYDAGEKA